MVSNKHHPISLNSHLFTALTNHHHRLFTPNNMGHCFNFLLKVHTFVCLLCFAKFSFSLGHIRHTNGFEVLGEQPISKIAIHQTTLALNESASIKASPHVLGLKVSLFFFFNVQLILIFSKFLSGCDSVHSTQYKEYTNAKSGWVVFV